MTTTTTLTTGSAQLFEELAKDAGNWNGNPLIDFDGRPEKKGHLTDLKRKGLIETFDDNGCTFAQFTLRGIVLAVNNGHDFWVQDFQYGWHGMASEVVEQYRLFVAPSTDERTKEMLAAVQNANRKYGIRRNFYVTLRDANGETFDVNVVAYTPEDARTEAQNDFGNTEWVGTVWDSTPF